MCGEGSSDRIRELMEKVVVGFKAAQKLLVCYRLGRRPSEKIFIDIEKGEQALAKVDSLNEPAKD
jgi:hypothetical protein